MPIYDYKCLECGHEFEEFARISDPPATGCPTCGQAVRRLISSTIGNVERRGREYFKEVIEPEAKRIAKRIRDGDENEAADVLGEDKMR